MNVLGKTFQHITQIGIQGDMPLHEKERITKLNKLYLLTIPACIMGSVWSFDSLWFLGISMSICFFMQFCLVFHYLGWYKFANIYANLIFNILCFVLAICFNGVTGTENYLFVDIIAIQMQYHKSKGNERIVLSIIVFLLYLLIKIINWSPHAHLPIPKYAFIILMQNIVTIFFLIMYLMHEYLTLIQNYQSEIERQNQTLALQKAELISTNQLKDQLFSIIGHDLNKPLASVKGMIGLMSEDLLTKEQQKKYLNQLTKLLDITDLTLKNLLDWGLHHDNAIQTEDFEIYPAIIQNIQLLSQIAQEKHISIHNEVDTNIKVLADPHHFSFILRNLIANALKFTHKGGKIVISAKTQGDFWEISVKDNGIGINAMYLDKLFNLEKRFSTLGTERESGTGLGLPLCKQFVIENGGNLSIVSEEGKGSIFSFTLPKSQT
jgi:signal transduction histidine kinase